MAKREYKKERLAELVPLPKKDANKYSRGKLVLFVGSEKYPGAAILAARASARSGCGYSHVVTSPSVIPLVQSAQPSLVVSSWSDILETRLEAGKNDRPCAYVLGSGFDGHDESTQTIVDFVLKETEDPLLIDGGAFVRLAEKGGRQLCVDRFERKAKTIITPHQGEASRLAQSVALQYDNAPQLALGLAQAYKALTLLKGPTSYLTDGTDLLAINCGGPELAKAGTGDVLAGICGAFLAQGMEPWDAIVLASTLHAHAGSLAAHELTEVSVIAEDLIDYVPRAIALLLEARG